MANGLEHVHGEVEVCDYEKIWEQVDIYEAETDKETKRASAKQKLQDLGLTVDEIKEAFGI